MFEILLILTFNSLISDKTLFKFVNVFNPELFPDKGGK